MTKQYHSQLWQNLYDSGLVEGEPPQADREYMPWYLAMLVGLGAWLAALFLVAASSLFFDDLFEHGPVYGFAISLIWSLFSYFLATKNDSTLFVEHLSIAAAFVAQLAFVNGVAALAGVTTMTQCVIVFFSFLLAIFFVRIRLVLFSLAIGAAAALYCLLIELKLFYICEPILLAVWLYLISNVGRWLQSGILSRILPVVYALTLSIIFCHVNPLDNTFFSSEPTSVDSPIAAGILSGLLAIFAVKRFVIERMAMTQLQQWSVYGAVVTISLLGVEVPGLVTSLLFLMVGFAYANRLLQGIAILSFFLFLIDYYYTLQATLLEKSLYLFVLGVVLLGTRLLMNQFSKREVASDA